MQPTFIFNSVKNVFIEDGAAARLGAILKDHGYVIERVLIITDKALVGLGMLEPLIAALEEHVSSVAIFDDVEADPSEKTVLSAVEKACDIDAELIIGFGGGSPMDVAKLVAVLANGSQALSDIYGVGNVSERTLPLIQLPTTSGTGSEVTPIAIITTGENSKMGVVDPHLYADMAILDATLTLSLPPHITAATGIDAMVHAIEAYTSAIKKNPMSDALARQALMLLGENIVAACQDGKNLEARRAMLTGAMMAGVSFANAPVAAVHALAYPLGGRFHIPHGLSNALVLPHVLKFNMSNAAHLYAELAETVGLNAQNDTGKTIAFIDWLEGIAETVAIERRLRELDIQRSHLDMLASDAMEQTRLLVNNPRDVTLDDAYAIYEAAW